MKPHREWFYEYENYERGNVLLGDDSTTNIVGQGRFKMIIKDERGRPLIGVLQI
jgi:hypothetical protein